MICRLPARQAACCQGCFCSAQWLRPRDIGRQSRRLCWWGKLGLGRTRMPRSCLLLRTAWCWLAKCTQTSTSPVWWSCALCSSAASAMQPVRLYHPWSCASTQIKLYGNNPKSSRWSACASKAVFLARCQSCLSVSGVLQTSWSIRSLSLNSKLVQEQASRTWLKSCGQWTLKLHCAAL